MSVTLNEFEYARFVTKNATLLAVEAALVTRKSAACKVNAIKCLLDEQNEWEEKLREQEAEAENRRREMNNKLVQEENKRKLFLERKKNGEL